MPDIRDFEPTLLECTYELRGEGRAAGTIGNYTRTLTTWATWLADQDDAPDVIAARVGKEHITRWLAGRQKSEAAETVLDPIPAPARVLQVGRTGRDRRPFPDVLHEGTERARAAGPILTAGQLKAIFSTRRRATSPSRACANLAARCSCSPIPAAASASSSA